MIGKENGKIVAPNSMESESRTQRDNIISAAVELMAETGIDRFSMRALGQRMGFSPMMPYRHFASKEALFVEMRRRVFDHFGKYIEDYAAASTGAEDNFRRACRGYIGYGLRFPADYDFVFGRWSETAYRAVVDADGPSSLVMTRSWAVLLDAVTRLRAERTTEKANIILAHLVWQSLHGLLSLYLAKKLSFGLTLEELCDPVVENLLTLVKSDCAS